MEGIYVYPIFLFKIAGQSLLPCVVMVLLYIILLVFIVLMMTVMLFFFFNMRARVSECVSLIIFIFWLYSVNDPTLVHLWKKKKQLKNGKKMLMRDL